MTTNKESFDKSWLKTSVESNDDAVKYIRDLGLANMSSAMIRHRVASDKSPWFKYVQEETQALKEATRDLSIADIQNNVRLKQRLCRYYDLFLHVEQTFSKRQDLPGKGAFGSTLCKNIVNKLAVDKDFVREFLGVVNWKNKQKFEAFVTRTLIDSQHKNADIGLKDVLAGVSDSMLSPSTAALMDTFLNALNKVETSRRYEILARVDAYIRSGWAKHDLESDPPSALKTTLDELARERVAHGDESQHVRLALSVASTQLFDRFDHLFRKVQVQSGKAIDHGIFAIQPGYRASRDTKSLDTAAAGHIDVAICGQADPSKWYFTLVTSTLNAEQLDVESNQFYRHREAVNALCFVNGDTTTPIKTSAIDFSIMYGSLLNTSNGIAAQNKFAKQLGVDKNNGLDEHINALVPLTLLSNTNDITSAERTRFVAVGHAQNQVFENQWSHKLHQEYASRVVQNVLPQLKNALEDATNIPVRSKLSLVVQMCSKVINQFAQDPNFMKGVELEDWKKEFRSISKRMKGAVSDVSALAASIGAVIDTHEEAMVSINDIRA